MKQYLTIGYTELCALTSDPIANRILERSKITTAYHFNELSRYAKLHAVQQNREICVDDGWDDEIKEDAESNGYIIHYIDMKMYNIIGVWNPNILEVWTKIFANHIEQSPLRMRAVEYLAEYSGAETGLEKEAIRYGFQNSATIYYLSQLTKEYHRLISLKAIVAEIKKQNLLFTLEGDKFSL